MASDRWICPEGSSQGGTGEKTERGQKDVDGRDREFMTDWALVINGALCLNVANA